MSEEKKRDALEPNWPYVRPTNPPDSGVEFGDFFIYVGTVAPKGNTLSWGSLLLKKQLEEDPALLPDIAESKAKAAWKAYLALKKDYEEGRWKGGAHDE